MSGTTGKGTPSGKNNGPGNNGPGKGPGQGGPTGRNKTTGKDRKGSARARAVASERLARQRAAERRRRAIVVAAVVAAVLAAAALVGTGVYLSNRPEPAAAVPKGADRTGVLVGRPDAKVTVHVYADFLCPACKAFEQQSGPVLDRYVAAGTVAVRHHPVAFLNRFSSGTEYSTRSAAAAGCAADAGQYTAFAQTLFEHQPAEGGRGLSNDRMIELAADAGITGDRFATCVRDQTYAPWVEALTDTASREGVSGTPTVLVAGEQVHGPGGEGTIPTPQTLTAALDKALATG